MSEKECSLNYVVVSKGAAASQVAPSSVEDIHAILATVGNPPLKHSFFISHRQVLRSESKHLDALRDNAGDLAATLNLKLRALTELTCWFDQDADVVTVEGMVRGIVQSAVFMLVLTRGVFERPFIQFEVRTAVLLKKKIIMATLCLHNSLSSLTHGSMRICGGILDTTMHEEDSRKSSFANFNDYFTGCPPDLLFLRSDVESRAIRRKGYEQEAMLADILRGCRMEVAQAAEARVPLRVLDVESAQLLRRRGDTAACYVDLGSGQSVVYLLSLNQDASLRYQEVYKDNCCFLDYAFEANPDEGAKSGIGSNERSKARASFVDAFRKVGALLDCAGKPESSSEELEETDDFGALQLFQVFIGATAFYRKVQATEGEAGLRRIEAVKSFFHSTVLEAGLHLPRENFLSALTQRRASTSAATIAPLAVEFNVIPGEFEARLEWCAVKTACEEVFGRHDIEPFACCAGGNGSIQVSSEHTFDSLDNSLAEGAAVVSEHGIEAYCAKIRPAMTTTFRSVVAAAKEHGRSPERPLRLAIISGFYYAAVACNATNKKDLVRWRSASQLLKPARSLLANPDASPKDRANVARLLTLLEVLCGAPSQLDDDESDLEGAFQHVEVLFVREWEVRCKPYKASWCTGKFLRDMREKKLEAQIEADSMQRPPSMHRATPPMLARRASIHAAPPRLPSPHMFTKSPRVAPVAANPNAATSLPSPDLLELDDASPLPTTRELIDHMVSALRHENAFQRALTIQVRLPNGLQISVAEGDVQEALDSN